MQIEKVKYPDGSFYAELVSYTKKFTYRINSYNDLWHLKQIKDVLDHQGVNASLTIPCLLDAQADRRFEPNQSSNLRLVCQFINDMKWERVKIFHPHNQEVVEALIDRVHIINNTEFIMSAMTYLTGGNVEKEGWIYNSQILNKHLKENLILCSTDAGGFKPLMKLANESNWEGEIFSASKSRKYEDGESKLTQQIDRQDFDGKDVLIVDDLSVYGGTFIGLAKMLRERNAGKLYLAISHLTVEQPNPELWKVFDKVFTTNSKGLEYSYFDKKIGGDVKPSNLEVINLFEELVQLAIQNVERARETYDNNSPSAWRQNRIQDLTSISTAQSLAVIATILVEKRKEEYILDEEGRE